MAARSCFVLEWIEGTEDIARVATALLAGAPQPNGTVFPLIGDAVSIRDIIDTLSAISGKPELLSIGI